MKKTSFLIVIYFFGTTLQNFGQGHFKIKSLNKALGIEAVNSDEKIEFIVPPSTHWGYKKNGIKKCIHKRFYYIEFFGLTKDYFGAVEELYETESWSGNTDYFEEKKIPNHNRNKLNKKLKEEKNSLIESDSLKTLVSGKHFKCATLDNSKSVFFIQIEYETLLEGDRQQIIDNFNVFAQDLLIEISKQEEANEWAKSISQNLVEKVFELIPVSQEASLSRYLLAVNDTFSFVLLNPKIGMMVDHSERSMAKYDTNGPIFSSWQMNYLGQSLIRFYRDEEGVFKQTPFINTTNKQPNNDPENIIANSVLLSSSADIQLTEGIKCKKYIGVFQYSKVRNNNSEQVKAVYLEDNVDGNSQVLFFDEFDTTFFKTLKNTNPSDSVDGEIFSATFGMRNIITPVIQIYINGERLTVPLNSTCNIIKQQGIIPCLEKIKVYRLSAKGYGLVKGPISNLKFLPNDKIEF